MSSKTGFTLAELMVSIAILTLISTTTVFALRTTRENDELQTATRILSGDIRNMQARALAAQNVRTCEIAGGTDRVCEDENTSLQACVTACAPLPPPRFGLHFQEASGKYALFADVSTEDWRLTNAEELLAGREVNPIGGDKVEIASLETEFGAVVAADIAIGRQSGTMRIEACGDSGLPACSPSEPQTLTITLRHVTSGKEATVSVNALTGRVSIP